MPMERGAALQLGLLLLAVPLQLFIATYYNAGDETQRVFILKRQASVLHPFLLISFILFYIHMQDDNQCSWSEESSLHLGDLATLVSGSV
jgi:hypothetical protein